jgi:uncharacterized protein (DUF58 family)
VSTDIAQILGRERTPAEPGPGRLSTASLRALDLEIGRRMAGQLSGDYRSSFAGVGTELHQVRPYAAGDDVRKIDWNVYARTGELYVRVEVAERILVTWVVVDLSASMAFGTSDRRKADVAEGVAIAVGHVASRRGNRLGVVAFGPDAPRFERPREGRRGLLQALSSIDDAPAGAGSLDDALRLLDGLAVQRSLVAVVSDFRGPRDWEHGLQRIAARHLTLAVEIRDRREHELVDVGEVRLEDPESGRQLLVDTRDPEVRAGFARASEREREEVATTFAAAGVPHVVLATEGDWLRPLAAFLRKGDRT